MDISIVKNCYVCDEPISINIQGILDDPHYEADTAAFCRECGEAVADALNMGVLMMDENGIIRNRAKEDDYD